MKTRYTLMVALSVLMMSVASSGSFAQGVQPRVLVQAQSRRFRPNKPAETNSLITLAQNKTYSALRTAGAVNCLDNTNGTTNWVPQSWPFQDIALDAVTGCVYGTPKNPAAQHVSIHLTPRGTDIDVLIQITDSSNSPVIVTTALRSRPTGEAYSDDLVAFGGMSPYLWKITSGTLPTGLSLDPAGRISGTATEAGTVTIKLQVTDQAQKTSAESSIAIPVTQAPDCTNVKYGAGNYFNGFVPLSRSRGGSLATNNDVVCFWGASGVLAPLTQVQYLYGFGQGTNTLSADMLSIQFPAPTGVQVSLGTSVTGGGSANATTGQISPAAAIASLEAGGNFYLHAVYPIYVYNSNSFTFLTALNSKFGFAVNGFAGQATLSQGTEQYVSVPAEMYLAYNGIGNGGGFYADYRGGLQSVPGSFKVAAGLPSNTFGLQQLSFGFNFGGLMRIGAQRFFGPQAGFNAPAGADFNKWHLVIQLSPGAPKGN